MVLGWLQKRGRRRNTGSEAHTTKNTDINIPEELGNAKITKDQEGRFNDVVQEVGLVDNF